MPPKDQRDVDRLGLMYFSRPRNDLPLKTIESPVLQEARAKNDFELGGHNIPTMEEFTKLKQKWNQRPGLSEDQVEGKEILPGVIQKRLV